MIGGFAALSSSSSSKKPVTVAPLHRLQLTQLPCSPTNERRVCQTTEAPRPSVCSMEGLATVVIARSYIFLCVLE
jgi:hypothetical protein